jgi:hypothetical protein
MGGISTFKEALNALLFFYYVIFVNALTNVQVCSDIEYALNENDCYQFQGLQSWTQSYVEKLCRDGVRTDKNTTATLCSAYADNEDYYTGLKLAILNTMYGTTTISVTCGYFCMYDPLHVTGDDAVGFKWDNRNKCWTVVTGATNYLCYTLSAEEYDWAQQKSENWCLGSVCEAYGDPHVWNFDGEELDLVRGTGDYIMFVSSTLRIDLRMRPFYSNAGVLWSSVSGVHATAIEVIDGECDVKIEVYSRFQTPDGNVRFLFNGEEIGLSELTNRFSTCDEICSNLYEVDLDRKRFTVVFADKVMLDLKNVENMHALFVTVPYETTAADEVLINEKQACTGGIRKLDCDNDTSIFTYHDYDMNLGRYLSCKEAENITTDDSFDCDPNIANIASDVCASCDNTCVLPSLVKSCEFDVCVAPGVRDAWNEANEDEARNQTRTIVDQYCAWAQEEIESKPWLCPSNPTTLPTNLPVKLPTRSPTFKPSVDPTPAPTAQPTPAPSSAPTKIPTEHPSEQPSLPPTNLPTLSPSESPTVFPTANPTPTPTVVPTLYPTPSPTNQPSAPPTEAPTPSPTEVPTESPTNSPTVYPTWSPTSYPMCAFLAYDTKICVLPSDEDYVQITDIEEPDLKTGLQNCAQRCFREGSNWLHYTLGSCRCVLGRCQTPLDTDTSESTYRIMPCDVQCKDISSAEWWGQEPTTVESMNGILSTKPKKGVQFTSEIYGEVFMVGIEIEVPDTTPPEITDTTLLVTPSLYQASENYTIATGESGFPAFMDELYDQENGNVGMIFLNGNIYAGIPYTLSFEFIAGQVNVKVSDDTHIFHDGEIAEDVFAVKGGWRGSQPTIVDTKAPHVVICYVEEECIERQDIFTSDYMNNMCPEGFGATDKTTTIPCNGITQVVASIQRALTNRMFESCESECVFDSLFPQIAAYRWNSLGCWDLQLYRESCAILYPEVLREMYTRADLLCQDMPTPTGLPTVPNVDRTVCDDDDINSGTHVLLSIDSAYEVLPEICEDIKNQTALLDGGYIFGSGCTIEMTVKNYSWDVMYCASVSDYCDYNDLYLNPDFEIDTSSTLVLMRISNLMTYWGGQSFGLELTIIRSLELNAAGLYLNDMTEDEYFDLYIDNETGSYSGPNSLPKGKNAQSRWYYTVLDNVRLDSGATYQLIFNFDGTLNTALLTYVGSQMRVYTDVTLPITFEDSFVVSKMITGHRGGDYTYDTNPIFMPLVSLKFCRDVPTPLPTVNPTPYPTPLPTDFCLNIHMKLMGFSDNLYDIPYWYDIFGGEFRMFAITNDRFNYKNTKNTNLMFFYTGSEWKVYDESGEYHFELTNPGEADKYYATMDEVTVWQYFNDQPGHEELSGEVKLYLTCDSFFPPAPSPTSPTEMPSLEEMPCAILQVIADDITGYDGFYYIVHSPDDYQFRSYKNQWYKNDSVREGHIFWMGEESPLWPDVWAIQSQAGYLIVSESVFGIEPPSTRYNIYEVGMVSSTDDTSVSITCATKPPTFTPTSIPTRKPTEPPTLFPTRSPTIVPSKSPTVYPTRGPSSRPTVHPTMAPTTVPTDIPTKQPTAEETPPPSFAPICEYYTLVSDDFDEFNGEYVLVRNGGVLDRRNDAPQWQNKAGYIMFYQDDGVFGNRWTIQALDESIPRVSGNDYYIISAEVGTITDIKYLNNPPTYEEWQIFSAETWHIVGDFFMTVELICEKNKFPTLSPTGMPSYMPTVDHPCIYVNYTYWEDRNNPWWGVYTRIYEPLYKNGKIHYEGPGKNELYWMSDGIFGQRWIIACANGTVLAYEDDADSTNPPSMMLWQNMEFTSCSGHCVDFKDDVNITITNLGTCSPTKMPTPTPTISPSVKPTAAPTVIPTVQPTIAPSLSPSALPTPSPTKLPTTAIPSGAPSLMPSPSPTVMPTTVTPEPTEHPTADPTESPTVYPTSYCECLNVSSTSGEIEGLLSMTNERNGRFQWEDGQSGWTLYWVEEGLFETWIFQGNNHDAYYSNEGRVGDKMPPSSDSWQKFQTSGYNIASDEFIEISIACAPCAETISPTSSPTRPPSPIPTPSPTCTESYIKLSSCCDEDFEGIYERQIEMKNGKHYYVNRNGYTVYYVHNGMFQNHWVSQSPDNDYFYLVEHAESGNEPVLAVNEWFVYRGASFSYISMMNITVLCADSLEPTTTPTAKPSREPTKAPSRSPSSSPTIYPTSAPSFMPTTIPTPAPSPMPSEMPSPSPTKLPKTPIPSKSPSLMPSPSPTMLPSTSTPIVETNLPTSVPTISPTMSPTSWCGCISVTGTGSLLDGVYMQNGIIQNQHYVWENSDGLELNWNGGEVFDDASWLIVGYESVAAFQLIDPNWLNTPPMGNFSWTSYSKGSISGGTELWLTLTCVTCEPTSGPTGLPTGMPSMMPSPSPTFVPTTPAPSPSPSLMPSRSPTLLPSTPAPSSSPSQIPSPSPSQMPSVIPTLSPTNSPLTPRPSSLPSAMPSPSPSQMPSNMPTSSPTKLPTTHFPTSSPSAMPSPSPSPAPSAVPTPAPSLRPSTMPTSAPTKLPTTSLPSSTPSAMPSQSPTNLPTTPIPSTSPSAMPSPAPSTTPSSMPTQSPTRMPIVPTSQPTASPTNSPSVWCRCLTVDTNATEFAGHYTASGLIINMHYQWETTDGRYLHWASESDMGDTWIFVNDGHQAAYGEAVGPWKSHPQPGSSLWDVYDGSALTGGSTSFMITCDTCAPTPMPSPSPTRLPITPTPTNAPSMLPSPSPSTLPSALPTPTPTKLPTTSNPSNSPSILPTPSPTKLPTTQIPSSSPSFLPTPVPSSMPTVIPTPAPTKLPTSSLPTPSPSLMPSPSPTKLPTTPIPSPQPSTMPSPSPSPLPSSLPSPSPTMVPTVPAPSTSPSMMPSPAPSNLPTTPIPSQSPSAMPSPSPSPMPSSLPSPGPTKLPTTLDPTPLSANPTLSPTFSPSPSPTTPVPSPSPSQMPSPSPSQMPSTMPTPAPTSSPVTPLPSPSPSQLPSPSPSQMPSVIPTSSPTALPTTPVPSGSPSLMPSPSPTKLPTTPIPSSSPSSMPSPSPSSVPSSTPSLSPTKLPSVSAPTLSPSSMPSPAPSPMPSSVPSSSPTALPTTSVPSASPSLMPSPSPTDAPVTSLPSPSPSVMPTPSPSQKPSPIPSPSPTNLPTTTIPSPSPSIMPSPSPTDLPTVSEPTPSPSLMPSPSPSQQPSVIPTPAPSAPPTVPPTMSPSSYGQEYCRCIEGSSTEVSGFDGVYRATGRQRNAHMIWKDNDGDRIYFANDNQFPGYWFLEGDSDVKALYEVLTLEWDVTPPLKDETWDVYSSNPYSQGTPVNQSITLNCIDCPDTGAPTALPSKMPSVIPTPAPSSMPSTVPTPGPSKLPTTLNPTQIPSAMPSPSPSLLPVVPTLTPTSSPSAAPTTPVPSLSPSLMPSPSPTKMPSTQIPSPMPSVMPSPAPSPAPSSLPSLSPTKLPTTTVLSPSPSSLPSASPTKIPTTLVPSTSPSSMPSAAPSPKPSTVPTPSPTQLPTTSIPSPSPSLMPSPSPSSLPSAIPTPSPTQRPTLRPSLISGEPSLLPSHAPSQMPSLMPSPSPTDYPTTWCKCITLSSNEASGFDGTYQQSGHVINQHYHWETYNGKEIYWSEDGNWIIEGDGEAVANYKGISNEWLLTPPLVSVLWDVSGNERELSLTCDTCEPTPSPSTSPTLFPTLILTPNPSLMPSLSPSQMPTSIPTSSPTGLPTTPLPTDSPSSMPSPSPTSMSYGPTLMPSPSPTVSPTTTLPTASPSIFPTPTPTNLPTTRADTPAPSFMPSPSPSPMPSVVPTQAPTLFPTTPIPTPQPSMMPSPSPTKMPSPPVPSPSPSLMPSPAPSPLPSAIPTPSPTTLPTTPIPSQGPSLMPSPAPSSVPSVVPTPSPTKLPTTLLPSFSPSAMPSPSPSPMPTTVPTSAPSATPTETGGPTRIPSPSPTNLPSPFPTWSPTYTIPCITVTSEYTKVNGTYNIVPEQLGGKAAWENNEIELYFAVNGIFEDSWVIHDKITDEYLVWVREDPYKGDSYGPIGKTVQWQLFVDGVAPNGQFYEITIVAETTCHPTAGPSRAPTSIPTVVPTSKYLCVIITWDVDDPLYQNVPQDFYGAYYYNDISLPSDNDFNKFPVYPTMMNGKAVFTKKRNGNSISWFFVNSDKVNNYTWVADSEQHNSYLASTQSNVDADHPLFYEFPDGNIVDSGSPYEWSVFVDGAFDSVLKFMVQMSRSLDTCEMFDTESPTEHPTGYPSRVPTPLPSQTPTLSPSSMPSTTPTPAPSSMPSLLPSPSPTLRPTSQEPTAHPTPIPSQYPTVEYQCINITAVDPMNNDYNGVYSVLTSRRNGRALFSDANTAFDLYYVPAAVMIDNAWVLEGSSNSHMSIYDVDLGSWTEFGQSDEVPPYGIHKWKKFDSPVRASVYKDITLVLDPLENCVPTQGPTDIPTAFPTTSTPAPTTPAPTIMPTNSPSAPPSSPPTSTPTADPTKVCRVLVVLTPEEPGGTSAFEGSYVVQSVMRNGKFQWYNSNSGFNIYFVRDDWMPSSWIFQGDEGMDELVVFDDGTDGHPNLVNEYPDGEEWVMFYWGRNIQRRNETVLVQIHCIDSSPPTSKPSPLPSLGPTPSPTPMPSPMPSLFPSPGPSPLPSVIPTPSPSPMPSLAPSPSPTMSPTLPTEYPTLTPSNPPTSYPTHICPCITITSNDSTQFNGMYQLTAETLNEHQRWYNYDNLGDLYWMDNLARPYWLISVEVDNGYAMITDETGRWGHTPPVGTETWTAFVEGKAFISGGIRTTLTLDCTTCVPTPSPTPIPTTQSTPTPTTPSPTIMPTSSPSSMPSTVPTPSPSRLPTTLYPTPLSAEPTLMPSQSPSPMPISPRPTERPSLMPSPSPSSMPSNMPSPSPTNIPLVPTMMPSPSPTVLPTNPDPSPSPSTMPTPSPSPMPSAVPTPSPTKLPTTRLPSPQPTLMPSPAPTPMPSVVPSPSPSLPPTQVPSVSPTSLPTVTCQCLVVSDSWSEITDYVGVYKYKNNSSPNTDKWMWERQGVNTNELVYFSQFGTAAARWVVKGSTYGEWAETGADVKDVVPPKDTTWRFNNDDGDFYHSLQVTCTQCEDTPAPTPDPTETPTQVPSSLTPTTSPSPLPSVYCLVLNVTDLTNGFYTGYFEMDVLSYNGKHKWTDRRTGESLHWSDTAMFENEGTVEDIWMLGFKDDEGDQDSHFLILKGAPDQYYPPVDSVLGWMEYIYNEYSKQSSQVLIHCDETEIPTTSPTLSPTEPLCTELYVHTCCDSVYTDLDGIYQAVAHRGGKDMFYNSNNGYSIYYTDDGGDSYWSIRSEDEDLIWVENTEHNGAYPPWGSNWDLENHVLSDLKVYAVINCSVSFTPSAFPTSPPTKPPTTVEPTLSPSPMPTAKPINEPTLRPTQVPTESCVALEVVDQEGLITKYDGTYARLTDTKNGKTHWINYETGADVYWIDRGIWANTWVIRANDGDYLMIFDEEVTSLHPPLEDEWSALGNGLLHGDKFQTLTIVCGTEPPAPAPTTVPSFSPTCEGNAIYVEDPCNDNVTGGVYEGFYNAEYVQGGKNVYVSIDGLYEVSYISGNLYGGSWVIQQHDNDDEGCSEFFVVEGYNWKEIPPENAFWDSYGCACYSTKLKYSCNFKISCMHTMAPIPTERPTSKPTPAPIDTLLPTNVPSDKPTDDPTSTPTSNPTGQPVATPTSQPTTENPTQSPLPYECTSVDLQPCINDTNRLITFYERTENQLQVNSNYYETKLYTEQKGYVFTAKKDMVMYEAGMAFVNLASYQSITVRVFDSSETLLFESEYSIQGLGATETIGSPRGDYYTFRNMNVQLIEDQAYTVVFVIHCPATKTSRAEYPLCAPHHEVYSIDEFGTGTVNVYAYGEDYVVPTESDLYAPFVRICYVDGILPVR